MKLEEITNNPMLYEYLDIKDLCYKWLEYNLESKCMHSTNSQKRSEAEEKAEQIFYTILRKKKEDITKHLNQEEQHQFGLLLNKERILKYELTTKEEIALSSALDKEISYSFFLGYGFFKVGKAFSKSIERWEKTLEQAEKNDDITFPGRTERVVKIRIPFDKKTIIFKKAYGSYAEELRLENHVWMYYQWRLNTLSNTGNLSPDSNKNPYFNLPEKVLFNQGVHQKYLTYIIWKADSADLLKKVLHSDKQSKKSLITAYIQEVAKLSAFGPYNLVPEKKYLTTKEAFLRRMGSVVHEKASLDLANRIIYYYEVIANKMSESKIFGVTKDATLKNATYTHKGVTPIDFDKMRIAPLQMDLSKLLILSYNDRQEFIQRFIKEYNLSANKFNKEFAEKSMFYPYNKKCMSEPKRKKIMDAEEFYFTYLNCIIDYSLFFLFEDKYHKEFENVDIKEIQKENAISAINELKTKYYHKYSYYEITRLESLSELFKSNFLGLI